MSLCTGLLLLALSCVALSSPVLPSGPYSENWEIAESFNVSGVLPVVKYRSKRTGISVVIGHADSPIVNGYFCLPTEAFTQDGLPHTLEHLIFLGSESYPYKEVLDLMANRCLASRTNAWTDTDHTCYTVYTAGDSGFLNILPVYMDHILFPILRDEDFMTEVHHVNGEGEDAGVVYSEMQGVENSDSNILYFALVDKLFPGLSSYEIQTGGVLRNLRESTTNAKVRAYHKKYYQPQNVHITVTGNIEAEDIFKALDPVERKAMAKKAEYPPYERPFTREYPTLTEDIRDRIEFPSSEEKQGHVVLAWRLPLPLPESVEHMYALKVLGAYLTSSSVSPLMEAYVNIPEPLATGVSMATYDFGQPGLAVEFENIPLERLKEAEPKFFEEIEKIRLAGPEKFDMERIRTIIERRVLKRDQNLENSPHLIIPDPVVLDMTYGREGEEYNDLAQFLMKGGEEQANHFLAEKADFWIDLMTETFKRPKVVIDAYPSIAKNEALVAAEKKRVEEQKEKLGVEGLKAAGEAVKNAVESQKLPPQEVLESIPVADASKIKFRHITSYNYTSETQPEDFDLRSIPFKFHLDDISSKFIRYYMFLDMKEVKAEDIPWLVLMGELWLQSPMEIKGELIELPDVVKRRTQDTLTFYNDIGYKGSSFSPGSQSQQMMFYSEIMLDKYEEGIAYLKDVLFNVKFDEERTKNMVSKILNIIPSYKQKASSIAGAIANNIYFNNETIVHHASFLRQFKFITELEKNLTANPEKVLNRLSGLVKQIVQPKNTFVYMATNLKLLTEKHGEKAASIWKDFYPTDASLEFAPEESLKTRIDTPSEWKYADENPPFRHAVAGIAGTTSCYMKQGIPFNVRDWESNEVAVVRVMLQYLTDQMYNLIRGKGLSYGQSLSSSVTEGRIRLGFSRSSQLTDAYAVFRDIVTNFTRVEDDLWDETLLDSARGSQVYNWAENEETIEDLSSTAIKAILRGTADPEYNRRFVSRVANVTLKDVKAAAKKYLPLFLDPAQTQTVVTCGPEQVEPVKEYFDGIGYEMKVIEDLEKGILVD